MPLTALQPSQHLVDLVAALGGRWQGYAAICRCPAHADRTPSLSLRQGQREVLVTCFAGCRPEDILRELRLVPVRAGTLAPPPARAGGVANVMRLWERAAPVTPGSLAHRYLVRRGLDEPPNDLRFLARCPYGPRPSTVFEPALLVAVREASRLTAIQRIFIDPATAHYTRKAMLGTPDAGCWKGMASDAVLAIAEGMETAAAYSVLFGIPCWASLGARRLDLIALPAHVRTLIVARDEDPEGRRAADRAAERYAVAGRTVRQHAPPPPFKDWSQLLAARRERGGGSMG